MLSVCQSVILPGRGQEPAGSAIITRAVHMLHNTLHATPCSHAWPAGKLGHSGKTQAMQHSAAEVQYNNEHIHNNMARPESRL